MNIEIANRLVQLRKAHGLSQEELAAKLGLSRQAVSKWERAESSPDTDNLIMLSRLYGVSLDSLLATDEEIPMPDASDNKEEAEAEKKTGRDSVNISFREGINVTDDDGSHIHIGWDGIRMHDAGESANVDPADSVEVDDEGVTYTENGERIRAEWNSTGKDGSRRYVNKTFDEAEGVWHTTVIDEDGRRATVESKKEPKVGRDGSVSHGINITGFPYAALVTGAFLLLGFLLHAWHPAWLLFLTIPIYYPIASAIRNKKLNALDIIVPVIVVGVYVALGFTLGLWHPLWLMLLAIPLYFAISAAVHGKVGKTGLLTGVYTLIAVIVYLALGFIFGGKAWTVGWLIFFTVPMFSSIASSIKKRVGARWLRRFPWEVLITGGFLFVGLMYGIWHPTWVAFLLIPVLRWFIKAITPKKKRTADGVTVDWDVDLDDDDDDDDDC